jgi:hypothetical protein
MLIPSNTPPLLLSFFSIGTSGLPKNVEIQSHYSMSFRLMPKHYVVNKPAETVDLFLDTLESSLSNPNYFLGGVINEIKTTETAVHPAMRSSLWNVHTNGDFASNRVREFIPNSVTGVCYNHHNVLEPDWRNACWGSNYGHLSSIKDKYDPQHIFNCWHCVGYNGQEGPETMFPSSSPSVIPSDIHSTSPSLLPSDTPSARPSTAPSVTIVCSRQEITGRTFYAPFDGFCWEIDVLNGKLSGMLGPCSNPWDGGLLFSSFDGFDGYKSNWNTSPEPFGYSGSIRFVKAAVNEAEIEIIELDTTLRTFEINLLVPACTSAGSRNQSSITDVSRV